MWESPTEEIGDAHDTHVVAIRKDIDGEARTVEHIPRKISVLCSIFLLDAVVQFVVR